MMQFSDSHEWVQISGDTATVGVSLYAQKELGEVVYAQLPKVGSFVKSQEEVVVLESTKAAVDIYSPLSGEIIEVNAALHSAPEKINQSPEDEGWLYRMRVTNPEESHKLMTRESYNEYLNG